MAHLWRLLSVCISALPYILAEQNAVRTTVVGNTTLESPQVTDWGSWGPWEYCPNGTFVTGMQLKTLPYQGLFTDDSGLNAVRFYCAPVGGKIDLNNSTRITSTVGPYGRFNQNYSCSGPAIGFQLRSKEKEWFTDETAASNLRLYCDRVYHEGDGVSWGSWTGSQKCPEKSAICGLSTQVEPQSADVTALNNIKVQCCPVANPAEHCRPTDSFDLVLACDNLEAKSDTACTYERKIGASHWNKVSQSKSLVYEMYSNIGFTLPGALIDLPGNFGFNLNQSLVTGYNWTSSSSEMWSEETTVTVALSVPPETRTVLYPVYGKCDFYGVRANMFKRVDSDTEFKTKQVTSFTFMGSTPVPISQAPNNNVRLGENFESSQITNNVSLRASPIVPTEEPLPVHGTVLRGEDARRGEFPHHVGLRKGPGYYYSCGASIIHPFLLLTAAHCLVGKQPKDIQAIAGDHQQTISDGTEQFLYIESFSIHPEFNLSLLRNDIAIIKLKYAIIPSHYVKIINIPEPWEHLPVRAEVSGWGSTGQANLSDILQKAWLHFVDLDTCRRETGEPLNDVICAGRYRDACKGDSGGPLTCANDREEKYICGITSWGEDCEKKLKHPQTIVPGVFVDVRKYYGWIREHMPDGWRHYRSESNTT